MVALWFVVWGCGVADSRLCGERKSRTRTRTRGGIGALKPREQHPLALRTRPALRPNNLLSASDARMISALSALSQDIMSHLNAWESVGIAFGLAIAV